MRNAGASVDQDFRTNRAQLILLALISIAAGVIMGWYIVRSITRPLNDAVQFAGAIAEGDLTRTIHIAQKDETGVLLQALMEMKNRLLVIVQEVQNGSENISSAAAQIVAGNQDLAARTEEQASSVEQTAASMEQITATVKNTADHTSEATHLSADAASVVKNNGEMMRQVTPPPARSERLSRQLRILPSRPTFWRLTPPWKPLAPGNTGVASRSWRGKFVNWRKKARCRPVRSAT